MATAVEPQPALAKLRVIDAMHPGVVACPLDAPLRTVARMMASYRVHAIVVIAHGREEPPHGTLWGVISDTALVRAASLGTDFDAETAASLAAEPPLTIATADPLDRAVELMVEHGVSHLVVVERRSMRPIGVVSTLDVARALAGGLYARGPDRPVAGTGGRRRALPLPVPGAREEDDVHLPGPVHADGERLLDVPAPARPGDDRERARQVGADCLEQLGETRQDPLFAKERDVRRRQQRPRARLLRRGGEDDASGVRQPVQGLRDSGLGQLRRSAAVDVEAGGLRVARELVDEAHRLGSRTTPPGRSPVARPSRHTGRPATQTPTTPSGWRAGSS